MHALLARLPSAADLRRASPKIAGFLLGVVIPLVLVVFFQVLYTGYGIGETPGTIAPVYPNF